MIPGHAELHLPPDVVHVGLARLVVTQAARTCGLPPDRIEDLRIAVSEAVTNAILAHQQAGSVKMVVVAFGAVDDGRFEVSISDAGPGFEPMADPLEGRAWDIEGGLGITLIRGLADSVDFVRDTGMEVHMRFAASSRSRGSD